MHYLERYAATTARLRGVLRRKIVLSCRHHGDDPSRFDEMLDAVVAKCVASGLVDDARFAENRAATLRRKGQSARAVAAKLAAKGVPRDLAVLHGTTSDEQELAAARIAAKRKRLGPWSRGDRLAGRQKDLAALARAGFGMGIARAVIDGEGDDGPA